MRRIIVFSNTDEWKDSGKFTIGLSEPINLKLTSEKISFVEVEQILLGLNDSSTRTFDENFLIICCDIVEEIQVANLGMRRVLGVFPILRYNQIYKGDIIAKVDVGPKYYSLTFELLIMDSSGKIRNVNPIDTINSICLTLRLH